MEKKQRTERQCHFYAGMVLYLYTVDTNLILESVYISICINVIIYSNPVILPVRLIVCKSKDIQFSNFVQCI